MTGELTAIILAGGRGSRFGAPKAKIQWGDGTTLLGHVLEIVRPLVFEIIVQVKEPGGLPRC